MYKVEDITKGEWKVYPPRKANGGGAFSISTKEWNIATIWAVDEETEANAQLIAEAGTVANETGLSPRELLEQRNELLKVFGSLPSNSEIEKAALDRTPISRKLDDNIARNNWIFGVEWLRDKIIESISAIEKPQSITDYPFHKDQKTGIKFK